MAIGLNIRLTHTPLLQQPIILLSGVRLSHIFVLDWCIRLRVDQKLEQPNVVFRYLSANHIVPVRILAVSLGN